MERVKHKVRASFRNAVFERDGYRCRVCKAPASDETKLDAHHITDRHLMPNGGYIQENGISLCEKCHEKAEEWHRSGHTRWADGFHPNELYNMINSSLDRATRVDQGLAKSRTVKSPIYGNGLMRGPDGKDMCRIKHKRLKWYVDRDLATIVNEDPYIIQLKFSPKGPGHSSQRLLIQSRENICVVCGTKDKLTRHHIVPHCYRKFMPAEKKSHSSYDILPLCDEHHVEYEMKALALRAKFADKYGAPLTNTDPEVGKQFSMGCQARTLMRHGSKIPSDKVLILRSRMAEYLGIGLDELTDEHIDRLAKERGRSIPYDHAKIVMDKVEDLQSFVVEWRKHFAETMEPKFMPKNWDVDCPI